jgi:hypothetical protein
MKYSPHYFRPLGTGKVCFTCIRQDDQERNTPHLVEALVLPSDIISTRIVTES